MKYLLLTLLSIQLTRTQLIYPKDSTTTNGAVAEDEACVKIQDCPALMKLLDTNRKGVDEFERCGFSGKSPLYKCPALGGGDDACDCKALMQCRPFQELVKNKRFAELKSKRTCGFSDGFPMYCCPRPPPKRVHIETTVTKTLQTRQGASGQAVDDEDIEQAEEKDKEPSLDLQCGFQTSTKIFGGFVASDHEFPWAVAIAYINPEQGTRLYLCGGTLIDRRHVLTAAHCINTKSGHSIAKVRVGHANLDLSLIHI